MCEAHCAFLFMAGLGEQGKCKYWSTQKRLKAFKAGDKLGRTNQKVKKQLSKSIFCMPSLGTKSAGCFCTRKKMWSQACY